MIPSAELRAARARLLSRRWFLQDCGVGMAGLALSSLLARDAQAVVDAEAAVEVRVVDQALPADGGPGFLEIDAHDHQQVGGMLARLLTQAAGVLHGGLRVMDRTRPDDDQQAVVLPGQDAGGLLAGLGDDFGGPLGRTEFMQHHRRGKEGELGADTQVVRVVVHRGGPFPKEKRVK